MPKHADYTDELKWLQAMANELVAPPKVKALPLGKNGGGDECVRVIPKAIAQRYKGVNFFQGLWGYKEVALFLGIAPKTVLTAEFRLRLPAIALWQAKGTAEKTGQQVLRWRPIEVFRFREEKEQQVKTRLRRVS